MKIKLTDEEAMQAALMFTASMAFNSEAQVAFRNRLGILESNKVQKALRKISKALHKLNQVESPDIIIDFIIARRKPQDEKANTTTKN